MTKHKKFLKLTEHPIISSLVVAAIIGGVSLIAPQSCTNFNTISPSPYPTVKKDKITEIDQSILVDLGNLKRQGETYKRLILDLKLNLKLDYNNLSEYINDFIDYIISIIETNNDHASNDKYIKSTIDKINSKLRTLSNKINVSAVPYTNIDKDSISLGYIQINMLSESLRHENIASRNNFINKLNSKRWQLIK
jgi:hypothetical protein